MIEDKKLLKFYLSLSVRKREVLELVTTRGYSNGKVAARLVVTSATVADHLTYIYGELTGFEELEFLTPNRQLLAALFAPFFDRHPEMRNDHLQRV